MGPRYQPWHMETSFVDCMHHNGLPETIVVNRMQSIVAAHGASIGFCVDSPVAENERQCGGRGMGGDTPEQMVNIK